MPKKKAAKNYVHQLADGREATELEPGVSYLFNDGQTRLWFIKSVLMVDDDGNMTVGLLFQDINGKGKLIEVGQKVKAN